MKRKLYKYREVKRMARVVVLERKQTKEEHAVVLDFLKHGYPFDTRPSHRKTPIVQAIGKERFTLLELVPKPDVFLQPYEEVNETKFVEFFNKSAPLTTRMHQIELLPGVGKKHMWEIIEERKDKPFESFADIKKRVKLMPDPAKAVAKRILAEIEGKEKHRLFVDM
jgi:putative nucleotide binding protein